MKWFNKYVPRFMCVGIKHPHFGNDSHTICCDLTSILCRYQILEGKYCPEQIGQKEFDELGKC